MAERKPHRHAEVIKAWADGFPVQLKWGNTWIDAGLTKAPAWDWNEYRVKPEPVRAVGYRRYLWINGSGLVRIACTQEDSGSYTARIQEHPTFKGWIDTEWQYHEVEL